jgi:hypothetical protein
VDRLRIGTLSAARITPEHALVTMGLIDDVYRAAGLPPRGEARPT